MNAPSRLLDKPQRYRLRAGDFLLLHEHGAFADYAKTELIDGEIFGMNAQFATHARIKSRLHLQIARSLAEIATPLEAVVEVTVRVADDSAPEPDIVLTTWRGGGFIPVATVALVVEVADSTLTTDLGRKAELYGAAGILEYWVIDVNGRCVVTHTHPAADGYRERVKVPFGAPLVSTTIEGLRVDSARLED